MLFCCVRGFCVVSFVFSSGGLLVFWVLFGFCCLGMTELLGLWTDVWFAV